MIIQTNPLRFIGETETREVIFPFNLKIQLLLKSRSPPLRTVFLFSQPFSSASVMPPFQEMLRSQQCSCVIFSSTILFSLYHWEGNTPEKDLQDETQLPLQGSEVIHPAGSPEEQSGVEMLREQNRTPVRHCSHYLLFDTLEEEQTVILAPRCRRKAIIDIILQVMAG